MVLARWSSLDGDTWQVLRPMVEPLFQRYADMPVRNAAGKAGVGFTLRNFLEMCQEASLVGAQLSHVTVKNVFVHSLQINVDAEVARKPLLNRDEFVEALCRLAFNFDASKDPELKASVSTAAAGTPLSKRISTRAPAANPRISAAHVAADVSSAIHGGLSTPLKGGGPSDDGGGADAAGGSEMEEALLANLPLVCGKLLALLEHHVTLNQ